MEFQSELGNKSRHQNEIRENSKASCSRPRTKLRDILMSDKPALSYADVHHEIRRNTGPRISKSSGRQQSHGTQVKARDDAMAKHISKVSSHLGKGKPLTASSIDLTHLDKLYKHDPIPNKNSAISPSTSSGSYFSTDGSSTNSSRGNSSSPGNQRRHRSPSQPRLKTSLVKNYIQDEYYSGKGTTAARQITYHLVTQSRHPKQCPLQSEDVNSDRRNAASTPSHMTRQQNICVLDQNSSIYLSRTRSEIFERKFSESNTISQMEKQQNGGDPDLASSWKGKMRIQESELKEEIWRQSHEPNPSHPEPACSKSKEHQASVLLPRDPSQYSRSSYLSDSSASDYKIPREKDLKNLFQKNNVMEFHCSDPSRGSYSCPLPSTDDGIGNRQSEMRESCSMATTQGVNSSPQQFKSPSRSRNKVDMKLATGLKSSSAEILSRGVDKRSGPEFTSKVRQPSPIRRLSSVVGSFIRSAGSRENSPLRRSNSKDPVAISIDESCIEKSQANSRAKSSPLRRLLDPLLKSKVSNAREIAQPLKKSSDEQLHLSKEQPSMPKSTFVSSRAKQGSSLLQALLQVSVKNGLPLFTFAVDNDSDILAATLRKLGSPEKHCPSWIYTFFTVHEIKRKNGLWLNHGTKGNGNSYVPNVLAQMKAFNPQLPAADTKQKDTDGVNLREFTLFSVDTAQVDQHATEFQPTNELAAIVAKILKHENDMSVDLSHTSSGECQSLLSTTLILPGGVHTIPCKGPVSTLTQRWRFGGSCDCGGWDVGCQLRIFKQDKCEKSSNLLKSVTSPDEFKLFSQVGLESQSVLKLKPYKDRIYSIEFDSSISLLQAFATSVAVLDCRRSFSDSNVVEGRASTSVNILEDHFRMKLANESQGEAVAGHVSYPPPHSPVGRV